METLQLVCGAEKSCQLPPTNEVPWGMVIYKKVNFLQQNGREGVVAYNFTSVHHGTVYDVYR